LDQRRLGEKGQKAEQATLSFEAPYEESDNMGPGETVMELGKYRNSTSVAKDNLHKLCNVTGPIFSGIVLFPNRQDGRCLPED
jgi:hypothetical protein